MASNIDSVAANAFYGNRKKHGLPFMSWKSTTELCKDIWRRKVRDIAVFNDPEIAELLRIQSGNVELPAESFSQEFHTVQETSHMAISVTNPTLINNRSADSFSNNELIALIGDSVAEVKRLKGVGFESRTVAAMIAKEEEGQKAAIAILDARNDEE